MSTVTFTEQTPGSTASSTTQNANRSAWNTATASVDDANVRDEGLDHNSFADNVVETTRAGASKVFVSDNAFTSPAYAAPSAVTINAISVQVGALTPSTGDKTLVWCSALVHATAASESVLVLQSNTDGAGWVTQVSSRRSFSTSLAGVDVWFDYNVCEYATATGVSVLYRLYLETVTGTTTIQKAVMFAQVIAN
jgi:hypothetical protein